MLEVQKKYYDARHHCYAWVLGADRSRFRANDDGEPAHSAGGPIMAEIRSRSLTNVLVVVARYFGGVKLGVGGLQSAYRLAAVEALNAAQIVEEEVTEKVTINFGYESSPEVMKLIRNFELKIIGEEFGVKGHYILLVPLRNINVMIERISFLAATGSSVELHRESR